MTPQVAQWQSFLQQQLKNLWTREQLQLSKEYVAPKKVRDLQCNYQQITMAIQEAPKPRQGQMQPVWHQIKLKLATPPEPKSWAQRWQNHPAIWVQLNHQLPPLPEQQPQPAIEWFPNNSNHWHGDCSCGGTFSDPCPHLIASTVHLTQDWCHHPMQVFQVFHPAIELLLKDMIQSPMGQIWHHYHSDRSQQIQHQAQQFTSLEAYQGALELTTFWGQADPVTSPPAFTPQIAPVPSHGQGIRHRPSHPTFWRHAHSLTDTLCPFYLQVRQKHDKSL